MSPLTHFLASWIVAAKTTNNPRDCRLVTLAGILPDADGLGLLVDVGNDALGRPATSFYAEFHHWWLHGAFGAILVASVLALFARKHWRVALLCLATFHLHLLCDLVGSRGPAPEDLWPIYYLGPFSRDGMLLWAGQWQLDGWQNRVIGVPLLLWALWLSTTRNDSFVGVVNRRADKHFVVALRKWRAAWFPTSAASCTKHEP